MTRYTKNFLKEWKLKLSYCYMVTLPNSEVTIGPAENHDKATNIMTDQPPCLIVGSRKYWSYACTAGLQTSNRPAAGKSMEDNLSDHFSFFNLSINQVF
ncbi:hypothetical protein TNCV_3670631 [Trichonephila clavipes]|nr:hypothetical protein TNCV_3670631 [Trichonephila clavipes]